jgi:hypothetical protein
MQLEIIAVWVLLSACVLMIGRMVQNDVVAQVGAVMMLFTCAFAC